MQVYERPNLSVREKVDSSPVTEADEAADTVIFDGLKSISKGIPIVTEERAATHDLNAKRFLIVDPLDGTKEFIKRRGDFTVNIAFVEDGKPTLGVVYAPAKARMFFTPAEGGAVEETGTFDLAKIGPIKPIKVADSDGTALRVVASNSHRDQATDDYIARYNVAHIVSAGSSLKFCLVAAGEADLYPRLGPTMEWDTAAGHAVLLAAGGRVLDMTTQEPLTYGKPGFRNPFFLALSSGISVVE